MSLRLAEKSRVKTMMGIARTDTLLNDQVEGFIEEASLVVEQLCGRKFLKSARVEYHKSFEQDLYDPDPQYIRLKAYPVDEDESFVITYSDSDSHATTGTTLVAGTDYTLDAEEGVVIVKALSGLGVERIPLVTGMLYGYSPRGFQVSYTGGYEALDQVSSPPDPLDDDGMIQVPVGLRQIIAAKIGADWQAKKQVLPWSPEEIKKLYPYRRL